MNRWKRIIQIVIVAGVAGCIYQNANTLPSVEVAAYKKTDQSPETVDTSSPPGNRTNKILPETESMTDGISSEGQGLADSTRETTAEKKTTPADSLGNRSQKSTGNVSETKSVSESRSKKESPSGTVVPSTKEEPSEAVSPSETEDASELMTFSESETSETAASSEVEVTETTAFSEAEVTETTASSEAKVTETTASSEGEASETVISSETEPSQEETEQNLSEYLIKYSLPSQYLDLTSMDTLRRDLNDLISDFEGDWSIYIKNLQNSLSLTINNQSQDSASLIKLYIAGTVLEEIQMGNLEETDEIDRLLSEMITVSDNEAANELVRYLSKDHSHQEGLEIVNRFLERHDFMDTHQYNGLEDPSLIYGDEEEVNCTSVVDCGRFLEAVYEGDLVSHLSSRQLEGYLLDQDITWKIPAGIPSTVKTANKTGEKDNTQNDVSLVYTPYGDYILCVMATDLTDENTAIDHIRSVSNLVYEFFVTPSVIREYEIVEAETE